ERGLVWKFVGQPSDGAENVTNTVTKSGSARELRSMSDSIDKNSRPFRWLRVVLILMTCDMGISQFETQLTEERELRSTLDEKLSKLIEGLKSSGIANNLCGNVDMDFKKERALRLKCDENVKSAADLTSTRVYHTIKMPQHFRAVGRGLEACSSPTFRHRLPKLMTSAGANGSTGNLCQTVGLQFELHVDIALFDFIVIESSYFSRPRRLWSHPPRLPKHWQRAFGPSGCHIDTFRAVNPRLLSDVIFFDTFAIRNETRDPDRGKRECPSPQLVILKLFHTILCTKFSQPSQRFNKCVRCCLPWDEGRSTTPIHEASAAQQIVYNDLNSLSSRSDILDKTARYAASHLPRGAATPIDSLQLKPTAEDAKDKNGNTPLHLAAQYQGADVCKVLIEARGATVNAMDNIGNTPLYLAAWYQGADVSRYQ
ncbi:hypothetical protein L9F63_014251, partial [Diploptera punctata]